MSSASPSPITAVAVAGAQVISFNSPRLSNDDVSLRIWDEVQNLVKDFTGHLVINLAGIQYLSSMTLGKLISLQSKITARGGRLTVCGFCDDVAKAFHVSRLDRVLDCRATVDQATTC